jgi:phage terminase large subunit GpA-like protein
MLAYSDQYYRITSSTDGRQKWYTRPYQRDWFLAPTDPEVECMVCQKPSRVGWSEYVKALIAFFTDWRPSKVMVVQPTDSEVDAYSHEDIDSMFDDNHGIPRLKGMLSNRKVKGAPKNAYNFKQLLNGALIHLVSAATPRSGRRVERSPILFEEPATYDSPEGDTIGNLFQRAGNIWDPFFTIGGTPIYPNDYMDQAFKKGDQQYRYYPCPHCRHYQQLRWERFIKEGPDEGRIRCENCEVPIDYSCLREMDEDAGWACPLGLDRSKQVLRNGVPIWRSQQVGPGMSYHRAAMWPELVSRHRTALEQMKMGNINPMQTFHNTDLGVPWEDSITSKLTADGLAERRKNEGFGNGYPWNGETWDVPTGVLLLTDGIDVQGGGGSAGERLVYTLWGWGRGEEGWHIAHFEIYGDPQQQDVWDQIDRLSETAWMRQDGGRMKVSLGSVDHGGLCSKKVEEFCAKRPSRWVATKGSGGKGLPIIEKFKAAEVDSKNKSVKRGAKLYTIGYINSVGHLRGQLRVEQPGPGYLHFGTAATDDFLRELFPWKWVPKDRARTQHTWILPPGCRDEGGDCTRMAYAALLLVARRYNSKTMWDQLEAQVKAGQPAGGGGLSLAGWKR